MLISFIIFIITILLSYFLTTEKIEGKFELRSVLYNKSNRIWNKILVSNFICGFRDGALAYIVNILIFMAFNNELKMGEFTTFTSILVIISTYLVGRIYKKELRNTMTYEVAEKNTDHMKDRISSIILYIIVSTKFMDTTAIKVILPFLSSMILVNYLYLRNLK